MLLTIEASRIAVARDGLMLKRVPLRLRTLEVCVIAVANNKDALCYVDAGLKDAVLDALAFAVN